MKTQLKHLLDLPKEGFLKVERPSPEELLAGEHVLTLSCPRNMYILCLAQDETTLTGEDYKIETDIGLVEAPKLRVLEARLIKKPYSIDLLMQYNNKDYWYRVVGCRRIPLL